MRRLLYVIVAIGCLLANALCAGSAEAKRVAFVVGNADYKSLAPLKNPQRDAAAVADRLKDLGFQVTELFNADAFALERAARRFVAEARGADLALFYFAGHGVQLFDSNFLLARDADPRSASRTQDLGLDLSSFIAALRGSGAVRLALLIDACRDNPLSFEDTVRLLDRLRADPTFKSASTTAGRGTRGLAAVDLGAGVQAQTATSTAQTLLFFAAQPGAVSFDGAGLNSYYVEGLKEQLTKPDRSLTEILRGVSAYVRTVTGNQQVPQIVSDWTHDVTMGTSVAAAKVEYVVSSSGSRPLTPAERDLVIKVSTENLSTFHGNFIAKASIGSNPLGSDEDKKANDLGTLDKLSISYDLDRDGRNETLHVYFRQQGYVFVLEADGVSAEFTNCGYMEAQNIEIALRDINGDGRPEVWIAYSTEGSSLWWGNFCILEYKGLPDLAKRRRGNTGLMFVGDDAFRTLLRSPAGWEVTVAIDNSIKVCAGSGCHTSWAYSFDGEWFRLLDDGGADPTPAHALPFRDEKDRTTRIVSHLLKNSTPLTPYSWKLAQPKPGAAMLTALVGKRTELAFECDGTYASLAIRDKAAPGASGESEAQVDSVLSDGNFADAPMLIDGKACDGFGEIKSMDASKSDADKGVIAKLSLGQSGEANSCWNGLHKASIVTLPIVWQSKSLLQLRMTEAASYLAAAKRICSGDRGASSDVSLVPPVGLKAPSPPPLAPPDTDIRIRVARFISEQYFQVSSAAETRQIVAANVDSYGKLRTREEVVGEKMRYYAKWPDRTYTLMPETLVVSADPGQPGRWSAVFQYTFRVSNQKRVISGRGVARLGLVPAPGGGFLIASESGEVLERQ